MSERSTESMSEQSEMARRPAFRIRRIGARMRMPVCHVLALCLAAAAALGGCASGDARDAPAGGAPRVQAPPSALRVAGRPTRLTVGDVTLPASKTLTADPSNPAENDRAMAIDRPAVRLALRDRLRAIGYEDVELEEDRRKALASDGRKLRPEDMGLVLDTSFRSASLGRDADADNGGFSVVSWLFLGFISSWFSDHTYVLRLEPVFTLRDPTNARRPQVYETQASRARETFDLHERRQGSGAFIATIFLAPPFAFGSTPSELSKALAPACLREPVRELDEKITRTTELHVAAVRPLEGIRAAHPKIRYELRSPAPGTARRESTFPIELSASDPVPDRLVEVVIGDKRFPRDRPNMLVTHELSLEPGKRQRIRIVTNKGGFDVYELEATIERR